MIFGGIYVGLFLLFIKMNIYSMASSGVFVEPHTNNVGVGTTLPLQKLHVLGNSMIQGDLFVQGGNVGIGTTTPSASLEIFGTKLFNKTHFQKTFTLTSSVMNDTYTPKLYLGRFAVGSLVELIVLNTGNTSFNTHKIQFYLIWGIASQPIINLYEYPSVRRVRLYSLADTHNYKHLWMDYLDSGPGSDTVKINMTVQASDNVLEGVASYSIYTYPSAPIDTSTEFSTNNMTINYTSGSVGIGTTNPLTNLHVNGSFYANGSVVQVIQATSLTEVAVSSTTYSDIGLSASITPRTTTSKIMVLCQIAATVQHNTNPYGPAFGFGIRLLRGTTVVWSPSREDTTGPYQPYVHLVGVTWVYLALIVPLNYIDTPASTSSQTYKVQTRPYSSAGTVYINGSANVQNGKSSIILMEIAG